MDTLPYVDCDLRGVFCKRRQWFVRCYIPYRLIRLRDPNAIIADTWRGEWKSGCEKWNLIEKSKAEKLLQDASFDRAFWISLEEFFAYFRM